MNMFVKKKILTKISFINIFLALCLWSCQKEPNYSEDSSVRRETNTSVGITNNLGSHVEIKKVDKGYKFFLNGESFFVKGAAGREKLELVQQAGGNSIRTWSEEGLDTVLQKAEQHDLMVMAGLAIGREREGFNYNDTLAVIQQRERISETINQYKDNPSLLVWALGNEPELGATNLKLWEELDFLINLIHELDPHHPVTVVIMPWKGSIQKLNRYCPEVDFLSVNIFKDLPKLPRIIQRAGWEKPVLVSEWGAIGYWETQTTDWFAPIEQTTIEKYDQFKDYYEILNPSKMPNILGAYVFYWGQKQERTPTWFSLFLETGEKTALVDLATELWDGEPKTNHAPLLGPIHINGNKAQESIYLKDNAETKVEVFGFDTEGDPLRYHWEIIPEGAHQQVGGDKEERPLPIEGLIQNINGNTMYFKAPSYSGPFRVLVYAYDDKGNGASSNVPFFVVNEQLN